MPIQQPRYIVKDPPKPLLSLTREFLNFFLYGLPTCSLSLPGHQICKMASQPLRRNGGHRQSLNSDTKSSSNPLSRQPRAASSNLAVLELALLGLYPTILALGSFTALLSPSLRSTPYSPTTQSHPPHLAPSYFARKSNVFNLYFVKVAWAWYTAAFLFFLLTQDLGRLTRQRGSVLGRRRFQALARYALTTASWAGVTQWFFGPPLIDRGFRLSGGRCEMTSAESLDGIGMQASEVTELATAAACRMAGGTWRGGHDISGHVFILILGSAFLSLEAGQAILSEVGLSASSIHELRDVNTMEAQGDQAHGRGASVSRSFAPSTWFILVVVGFSWWMLLMTATYFHTWFEKVS